MSLKTRTVASGLYTGTHAKQTFLKEFKQKQLAIKCGYNKCLLHYTEVSRKYHYLGGLIEGNCFKI